MKQETLNKNSKFWLNSESFNQTGDTASITKKLMLLSYKRAISNFVKILTQKDGYEVKFSTGQDSYTDGKTVVISSKLDEKNFDLTVGLALHEASHLLLTDFNILTKNKKSIYSDVMNNKGAAGLEMRFDVLHSIFNIVEDRYIDNYVYTTAPGYRGYYQTLYDHYFRNEKLAKLLKTPQMREETVDNYISQLLNIVGLEFDVNCLKGMPEIVKLLDIANISRLTTTYNRLVLAADIYAVILKYVNQALASGDGSGQDPKAPRPSAPKTASTSNSEEEIEEEDQVIREAEEKKDEAESGSGKSEEESEEDEESEGNEGSESDEDSDDENLDTTSQGSESLSEKEIEEAERLLETAKDVVNSTLQKSKGAKSLNDDIEILDKADASIHKVDVEQYHNEHKTNKIISINTLLVKNLTKDIALSELFRALLRTNPDGDLTVAVNKGISLGVLLAKRMQVRNEDRSTVTNRLKNGKIFNRHISMLGMDIENVFYKVKTDIFKKSVIHISVDASGSMCGEKFNNSVMTATAIAKACTFLRGVHCIISFRSQNDRLPMMAIAYNSKKDHFSKLIELFPYLTCNSSTPEGLCYEVYKKFICEEDNTGVDKYVINLSDGEPAYGYYYGMTAHMHTKKAWNDILKTGVTGLSYFIADNDYGSDKDAFSLMYGRDSKFIDPSNIVQLTSTINEMLMSNASVSSTLSE